VWYLCGLLGLCLLVSLAAQAAWPGLLLFLLVLLGVAFAHMRQLRRLVQWIHAPVGSPVPQADGLWGEVFACLERRASMAQDQRQTLSRSLEQFREASQAMPDGVLYLSAEERIVWFNARAALHFGLEPEHDVGQPILNLVRQPEFGQYLRARLHQEPMLLRSIRGTGATLLIQLLPFGEDQKMLLSRDITQIERLETMRRDFVANVSHELRTPLTVVAGFLETVEEALHDAPPDEILGYIALASEQARRMQTLIEDLLTLSALETEAPLAPEEWIDVERMLVQVHRDTELLSAGRHRVHLSVEGATRLKPHPATARTPPVQGRRHPARQDGCLGVQGIHLRDAVPEALLRRVRPAPRGGHRAGGRAGKTEARPRSAELKAGTAAVVLGAAHNRAGSTWSTSPPRRRRLLNKALGGLESNNSSLAEVLEHIDFTRKVGQSKIPDIKLRQLISHFSKYRLRNEDFEFPDLLGAAYEYLIGEFADSAGKKGGEFYTPRSWCG
jgi:signal transduction histidine kinase